ncbi:MAG: aminoacyl-tRNA hydrolase [Candidatus Omnitrophica bacterium]|nr:aminoacyl-tRNA hydrolase [Candidatus Omnitrophota bacterium]
MRLIVGLGNPGKKYDGTRHNAGKMLVQSLARHFEKTLERKTRDQSLLAQVEWEGESVLLAVPETYMNLSGESVGLLLRHWQVDRSRELLVIVDDAALPFGKFRLRAKGSDGGHNGLRSINLALATSHYPRLRVGVAPPAESLSKSWKNSGVLLEDFLLSKFSSEEKKNFELIWQKGFQACHLWVTASMASAMNAVNP